MGNMDTVVICIYMVPKQVSEKDLETTIIELLVNPSDPNTLSLKPLALKGIANTSLPKPISENDLVCRI